MNVTKQISNYNHSDGNNIQFIVIHDTGCPTSDTAKNNADYFCGGDRQASAHYFVDAKSIYQVVEESKASWHCGDGGNAYGIGNHNSIGIEMCKTNGIVSDTTINNTLELVKSLMTKYNLSIDKVVRHYDASRKICPGYMATNNWSKWYDFKSRISGTVPVKQSIPYPGYLLKFNPNKFDENVKLIQAKLNVVADGYFGSQTKAIILIFQRNNSLIQDAIIGEKTWNKIFNGY